MMKVEELVMKAKGLAEYLQDDVDLSKKITYEQYQKEAAPGNSDHQIEDAYAEYCAVLKKYKEE